MVNSNQNILIAESGSTKTSWKLVLADGEVQSFSSPGVNPVLQSGSQIEKDQTGYLSHLSDLQIDQVNFYGAGCGTTESIGSVRYWLMSLFPGAHLTIDSDLVAAARSLFGDEEGIVAILGTGSNSCYYKNGSIMMGVPSLGYALGDEGSGNQIGRQLIKDFLRRAMPKEIESYFQKEFNISESSVLAQVYSQPYPNRYMASFVGPVSKAFGSHPYFQAIVKAEFTRFFESCLSRYKQMGYRQLGFVGSIAYHFKSTLEQLSKNYGFELIAVHEKPIDNLIQNLLANQKTNY